MGSARFRNRSLQHLLDDDPRIGWVLSLLPENGGAGITPSALALQLRRFEGAPLLNAQQVARVLTRLRNAGLIIQGTFRKGSHWSPRAIERVTLDDWWNAEVRETVL